MRPDQARSERTATQLLLRQDIRSLCVDPRFLTYDKRVHFDSLQHYCAKTHTPLSQFLGRDGALRDGCTLRRGPELYVVLYNMGGGAPPGRMRFTLAHEAGHICLGHACDERREETEANWFASQLMMPRCVLHTIASMQGYLDAAELSAWFGVSQEAARTRIAQLRRAPAAPACPDDGLLVQRYMPCIRAAMECPGLISV